MIGRPEPEFCGKLDWRAKKITPNGYYATFDGSEDERWSLGTNLYFNGNVPYKNKKPPKRILRQQAL